MNSRWTWAAWILAGALIVSARAADQATVKSDKVNVRGQASMTGETVTQLHKGESVTVLETIEVKKPKKGEPAKWLKIQLPANTPVWVFAPYIETTNRTVNVNRVNVRSGPGENFSVLGRVPRGTAIKEIRVVNNWMEIEAPTNSYAFVAAEYVDIAAPVVTETAVAATTPAVTPIEAAPANPVPTPTPEVVTIPTETAPPPTVEETATAPSPVEVAPMPTPVEAGTNVTATTPAPDTTAPVEILPKRTVAREGRVVISRSIQAPTEYALESIQTHRMINYLHAEDVGIKLKGFGGRKVVVTGEELIDVRWTNTPIIEVETINIVP